MHSLGYVHKDVKPENVLLDENGYIKLTDFGISKNVKRGPVRDKSGTLGYIAPEILLNKFHSTEVDLYALGTIVYECAHGKVSSVTTLDQIFII